MRVAQLTTRFPPAPGGVERHVEELVTALAPLGVRSDVLTSDLAREFPWERLPPDVPRREVRPWGELERLRAWSMPGDLHYTFFRGLEPALARHRPEIVHAHTYGTHQVAVARRYRRRTQTPFVLTAHFHPIWSIEGGWLRRRLRGFYDRRLAGPIVADAARVIVQTREEERLLRSLRIPLPPVQIIPPGLTPLASQPPGGADLATTFGLRGPFVLFVGRLASNKGLLDLVDAFAPLAAAHSDATLVLAGADGGMGGAVEARARARGLEARVRRLGLVDDLLLRDLYGAARLTVLPSEYEAFGLVLLESLAQGTPVVATRVGGIPEVVDDGRSGLLVPPRDPAALGAALRRLWEDPELARRLGDFGRREVVPRYRWESVADAVRRLYEGVLAG